MSEFKKEKRGGICFYNCDNIEFMKTKPDNYYDLAIVDPPYGINVAKTGKVGGEKLAKVSSYEPSEWDSKIPPKEYFIELQRVSKNQIIWGGNYMIEHLQNTPCFLIWDKNNTGNFADAELAWTSFKTATRIFKWTWNGMLQQNMKDKETRIHPTQKPKALYRWTLQNYAEKGMKILDTHGGSHTHAIAADMEGFELDIVEIAVKYFKDGLNAFDKYKRQLKLF